MSPFEAAEKGFRNRAVGDVPLLALLGGATRITPHWPTDTMQEEDFPRLTYFVVDGTIKRPGTGALRLQVDAWVWASGPEGGKNRLINIDATLESLFDEQHWVFGGYRLYGLCSGPRDHPADHPLRRQRNIEVRASPA